MKCIYSYEDGDYCLKHSHGAADIHCTGEDGCPDFAARTKAEYIEREAAYALSKKICDAIRNREYHTATFGHLILDWIDDLPAADVVPVVRCKDCKYGTRLVVDLGWHEGVMCCHGNIAHRLDFFCADGAKMDGGGK